LSQNSHGEIPAKLSIWQHLKLSEIRPAVKKFKYFSSTFKDLYTVFKHQNNQYRAQILSQGSLQQGSKTMKMCNGTPKTATANSRQSQNDVVK
jgi:hypothetical protein